MSKGYKIFVLSILILSLSACSLPWKKKTGGNLLIPNNLANEEEASSDKPATSQIKKFANYDELAAFLKENAANQNFSLTRVTKEMAVFDAAPGAAEETVDYSTTNNQVARVDEADIIKTDGEYIYALVRQELKIIKARPAEEAQVVGVLDFKSRPQGLFINGNSLIIFGTDEEIQTAEIYKVLRRRDAYTFLQVFDLADKANPKLVRDLKFEGSYTDARLIGDYAYLFTASTAAYSANESVIPNVLENGQILSKDCATVSRCYAPDVYYFDIPYESYNFTNVMAINTKDHNENIAGQSYLMSQGQNLYVSEKNIYITYTEYLNEYDFEQTVRREIAFARLSADDQAKITEIDKAPNYILNKEEKTMKAGLIIDRYISSLEEEERKALSAEIETALKNKLLESAKDMEKTVIHKIGIRGNSVEYRGLGTVNGRVLNQFSMDEHDTYFRIATTRSELWSRFSDSSKKSYNNVYILNNELKLIGGLENLALDEVIYSARFMGDRLYLVTFKQTDPLYVISLVDPLKPSVLGSVKVPGYSTYLHPVDQEGSKLIGIGRDVEVDENGNTKIKALKLSLFDFADLKAPKELDSFLIGDSTSDSIALYDHKAFLYSADKNLLVLPAVLRNNNAIVFGGSLVFNLENNKLILKGRIDHSNGGQAAAPDFWNSYSYYDNTVKRSLYINNNLYTFSNRFLKVNNLDDLADIKELVLTEAEQGINPPVIAEPDSPISDTPSTPPITDTPPPVAGPSEGSAASPSEGSVEAEAPQGAPIIDEAPVTENEVPEEALLIPGA